MANNGKPLEDLVKFVEERLLPPGFVVETRKVIRDEAGVPIAELDILIKGPVGSTEFSWLIECRDRPSDGPQGRSWINELVGRRDDFNLDRVTAVSTTGFSSGARERAKEKGIELREVRSLDRDAFTWLEATVMYVQRPHAHAEKSRLLVSPDEPEERKQALLSLKAQVEANGEFRPVLKSTKTGLRYYPHQAYGMLLDQNPQWLEGLVPNGPGKPLNIRVQYTNDEDHFVVETEAGEIRVEAIEFQGEVALKEIAYPLSMTKEYVNLEQGKSIAQYAAFAPIDIGGKLLSFEMHRMASGETLLGLRVVGAKDE